VGCVKNRVAVYVRLTFVPRTSSWVTAGSCEVKWMSVRFAVALVIVTGTPANSRLSASRLAVVSGVPDEPDTRRKKPPAEAVANVPATVVGDPSVRTAELVEYRTSPKRDAEGPGEAKVTVCGPRAPRNWTVCPGLAAKLCGSFVASWVKPPPTRSVPAVSSPAVENPSNSASSPMVSRPSGSVMVRIPLPWTTSWAASTVLGPSASTIGSPAGSPTTDRSPDMLVVPANWASVSTDTFV
jgi:hypothetical protein